VVQSMIRKTLHIILFVAVGFFTPLFGQSASGEISNSNTQLQDQGGIYIPNAFTPNGDGVNDEFYLTHADFSRFTISIFDRWGNQVYKNTDVDFRWNGDRGNDPVPSGTYVYVIEATTRKGEAIRRSGTVSVMR